MTIASTKPALVRQSVRNLLMHKRLEDEAKHHLGAFPSLENLWIIHNGITRATVEVVGLKHLYCHFDDLFLLFPSGSSNSALSNITHLEIFGELESHHKAEVLGVLAALPQLTHLALNYATSLSLCIQILNTHKALNAVIILEHPPLSLNIELATLADDPRFVMMSLEDYDVDWQRGVLTGGDYWNRTDSFIAKRISGEIDRE
jgi:hypothetical protein